MMQILDILETYITPTSDKYKDYSTEYLLESIQSINESKNKIYEALKLLKNERSLIIDELHKRGIGITSVKINENKEGEDQ